MKQRFIGGTCLLLGIGFLIPLGMQLWRFVDSRLSAHRLQVLPEAHTDFILSLNGRTIDSSTVVVIATVAGVVLLSAGVRILMRGKSQ